jgi:FtsZ-interacting cell division protein YlmF
MRRNIELYQLYNGNKETETPLDRTRRENVRKQNTNQTHTQQFRRATKNRKTKKAMGTGCRRGFEEDGRQGLAKKSKRRKTNGRMPLRKPRSYKDLATGE